jgi:hypothetical protein
MKKIIAVLILSVSLSGCAGTMEKLQAVSAGLSLITKSIANPVTKNEEAQIELAGDAVIDALRAYKKACEDGAVDKNCRANVAQIQVYTRQIKPLVAQLRTFVDKNDQLNASVVYNQLTDLYKNVKSVATNLGVNVGSLP